MVSFRLLSHDIVRLEEVVIGLHVCLAFGVMVRTAGIATQNWRWYACLALVCLFAMAATPWKPSKKQSPRRDVTFRAVQNENAMLTGIIILPLMQFVHMFAVTETISSQKEPSLSALLQFFTLAFSKFWGPNFKN